MIQPPNGTGSGVRGTVRSTARKPTMATSAPMAIMVATTEATTSREFPASTRRRADTVSRGTLANGARANLPDSPSDVGTPETTDIRSSLSRDASRAVVANRRFDHGRRMMSVRGTPGCADLRPRHDSNVRPRD